jgi:hypothetical protein
LNVSSNWIGSAGLAVLAEHAAGLSSLDISSNRLVRGGRKDAFDSHYFGDNAYDVDLIGITALVAALNGSSLMQLDASKNGIPEEMRTLMDATCAPKGIELSCEGPSTSREDYPEPTPPIQCRCSRYGDY